MLYIVHNHTTGEQSTLTQAELEAAWPGLKSGILEIVDEEFPDVSPERIAELTSNYQNALQQIEADRTVIITNFLKFR